MTNEEYVNQIVEIGNTLQIHPNSPKGQTLKKCIELLSAEECDYDKLMTISQQLAFENEELREKIEKIKTEIDNEWANTHHMYPDYAGGLARASEIIDKHIGEAESEVKSNEM